MSWPGVELGHYPETDAVQACVVNLRKIRHFCSKIILIINRQTSEETRHLSGNYSCFICENAFPAEQLYPVDTEHVQPSNAFGQNMKLVKISEHLNSQRMSSCLHSVSLTSRCVLIVQNSPETLSASMGMPTWTFLQTRPFELSIMFHSRANMKVNLFKYLRSMERNFI